MPPSAVHRQGNKMQKDWKRRERSEAALLAVIKPGYQSDTVFI